jgi:hypothetical protein
MGFGEEAVDGSLGTNSGSFDSLNRRTRCGCRPCTCQIRCTEETLIPAALAIMPAVQWVVLPGGSRAVRATTRSMGNRLYSSLDEKRGSGQCPAVCGQQNDAGSPDMLLRAVSVRHYPLKQSTVGGCQSTTIPLRMPQTRTTRASREASAGPARQIACTSGSRRLG